MSGAGNTANLRPFVKGDPRAVEAGKRSVEARRARATIATDGTSALRRELDTVTATFERGELGAQAAAVAGLLLAKVAAGVITVKGPDVAALLRVLVDVARLEAGEPTSQAVVAHIGTSQALERVAELRKQAREALGAVVVADAIDASSAAAVAVEDGGELEPAGVGVGGVGRWWW